LSRSALQHEITQTSEKFPENKLSSSHQHSSLSIYQQSSPSSVQVVAERNPGKRLIPKLTNIPLDSMDVCEDFKCKFNSEIRSVFCELHSVAFDLDKLHTNPGGEDLEQVWGQGEEVEFVRYATGAVSIGTNCQCSPKDEFVHWTRDFCSSVEETPKTCTMKIPGNTLALTRYEYANLFHTLTDWFNAFQTMITFELQLPVNVLLLDGHPKGSLDDSWERVFGQVYRIGQFNRNQTVCFEKLFIVSPGYASILFPGNSGIDAFKPEGRSMLPAFSKFFLSAYDIRQERKTEDFKVGYVLRKDYKAHPRIGERKASRKIVNYQQLLERVSKEIPSNFQVVELWFEDMSLEEQLKAVSEINLLVGIHGAGLSHLVFLRDSLTSVYEIAPGEYGARQFFRLLSNLKGIPITVSTDPTQGSDSDMILDIETHVKYLKQAIDQALAHAI
jgi:glycoprotein 2-beta-D-xylosyltransferase